MVKLAELNVVLKNDEDSMYRRIKDIEQENLIANAAQDIEDKANSRANKLTTFCETLGQTSKSKSDAMDAVTIFLASFLDVPSVYVALNKVVGESETLLYFSTNPENTIILDFIIYTQS